MYDEIKAKEAFLTMINATVSHELRNPLHSLLAQVVALSHFLHQLYQLIEQVSNCDLRKSMHIIVTDIFSCGEKMTSSTKFIDFFVHDILDYTILNKDEINFVKNSCTSNIIDVVEEIIEIMRDKT